MTIITMAAVPNQLVDTAYRYGWSVTERTDLTERTEYVRGEARIVVYFNDRTGAIIVARRQFSGKDIAFVGQSEQWQRKAQIVEGWLRRD